MNVNLGAIPLNNQQCNFEVWAPRAERVEVHLVEPNDRVIALERCERGYHRGIGADIAPGARYFYRLNSSVERPDPASRFQPEGVHGPSEVVSGKFQWQDQDWPGLHLEDFIIYEVHVGTFSPEGTLDAASQRLDELRDLGITAVELMPIGQFPGTRNWGYDGAYPFAVQASYGGPAALKRFVDACHQHGLAVVLDVIYNHLGPEGNYLADYGSYFTDRYRTPWGPAVNFDGAESDEVRRYFIENALRWVDEFHIDALRLDAIHAMFDTSAHPFLEQLGEAVHECARELNRKIFVIPESDRNDSRFVTARNSGGYGLDAQWSDDFHHSLHTLLTGEKVGYYEDFGQLEDLAKAYREGYVYSGQYSRYRCRCHGNSSRHLDAKQFVVFAQNHDQVGNRFLGDRLAEHLCLDALKLAAGAVILSPFLPLLFMGEEYGERAPFQFFTSHGDPDLVEAVREGRRQEFAAFKWNSEIPDPQSESTFRRAILNWRERDEGGHGSLLEFHRELIRLRKSIPALSILSKENLDVVEYPGQNALVVRRWTGKDKVIQFLNFSRSSANIDFDWPRGQWKKLLDSQDVCWRGTGSTAPDRIVHDRALNYPLPPYAFLVYRGCGKGEEEV